MKISNNSSDDKPEGMTETEYFAEYKFQNVNDAILYRKDSSYREMVNNALIGTIAAKIRSDKKLIAAIFCQKTNMVRFKISINHKPFKDGEFDIME